MSDWIKINGSVLGYDDLEKMVEMLNQACDEMLSCNKDSQANYYFDSCGWILTFLQDNDLRDSKA